jgi:hypothetical protein
MLSSLRADSSGEVELFFALGLGQSINRANRPDWKEKSTQAGGDVLTECSHHDGTTEERPAANYAVNLEKRVRARNPPDKSGSPDGASVDAN